MRSSRNAQFAGLLYHRILADWDMRSRRNYVHLLDLVRVVRDILLHPLFQIPWCIRLSGTSHIKATTLKITNPNQGTTKVMIMPSKYKASESLPL